MENVLTVMPDLKSRASLLLLNKQIFKDPNTDRRPLYQVWLDFRQEYLEDLEEVLGYLSCVYCGTFDLEIETDGVPPEKQATIDHVFPLSKGGKRYDTENLVVSCRVCNETKADKVI
jgi:5-methylcytosine-specific restriction endonuclease McrA